MWCGVLFGCLKASRITGTQAALYKFRVWSAADSAGLLSLSMKRGTLTYLPDLQDTRKRLCRKSGDGLGIVAGKIHRFRFSDCSPASIHSRYT